MIKVAKFRFADMRLLALHLFLFFVLLWVYQTFVVVIYGYEGYVDDLIIENIPLALLMIILSVLSIRRPGAPSNFFLHFGLALVVTPSLVLYCGSNLPLEFSLMTVSAFILMGLTTSCFNIRPLKFPGVSTKQLLQVLSVSSIVLIGSIFAFGGDKFINFDLSRVYEFRHDAAANLPGIYGYINSALGKIVIPFAIVLAILWRRWSMVAILSSCAVLLFAFTAHKSPLFYPLFVMFVYWIAQSSRISVYFLIALLAVILISAVDLSLFNPSSSGFFGWFGSLFLNRVILIPSLLDWFYFDWFSVHDKYFWSESKLTLGLLDQPDPLSSPSLIGAEYFHHAETFANTGWIGSGYANAGLIGVYLYSILIGLFFSFLDSYAEKITTRLVIALFSLPILTILTSTDPVTMLLTHGLVIAVIILTMIRPNRAQIIAKESFR